jgi:hypothetical protein
MATCFLSQTDLMDVYCQTSSRVAVRLPRRVSLAYRGVACIRFGDVEPGYRRQTLLRNSFAKSLGARDPRSRALSFGMMGA